MGLTKEALITAANAEASRLGRPPIRARKLYDLREEGLLPEPSRGHQAIWPEAALPRLHDILWLESMGVVARPHQRLYLRLRELFQDPQAPVENMAGEIRRDLRQVVLYMRHQFRWGMHDWLPKNLPQEAPDEVSQLASALSMPDDIVSDIASVLSEMLKAMRATGDYRTPDPKFRFFEALQGLFEPDPQNLMPMMHALADPPRGVSSHDFVKCLRCWAGDRRLVRAGVAAGAVASTAGRSSMECYREIRDASLRQLTVRGPVSEDEVRWTINAQSFKAVFAEPKAPLALRWFSTAGFLAAEIAARARGIEPAPEPPPPPLAEEFAPYIRYTDDPR